MSSIYVKEESASRLHVTMEPSAYTWAMAIGILSFIIGCPLYNCDCICLMLLVWILGTAAVLTFFSPWQELIVDKEKNSVVINRQNVLQRLNLKASTPDIYEFANIRAVNYELSAVVFTLANFETVRVNVKNESYKIFVRIKNILQLEENQTNLETPSSESEAGSLHSEAANEDGSSATSDDSFERIDSVDLVDYEGLKTELDNDIPSESIQSLSPSSEESKDLPSELEQQVTPLESTLAPLDQPTPESAGDFAGPSTVKSDL